MPRATDRPPTKFSLMRRNRSVMVEARIRSEVRAHGWDQPGDPLLEALRDAQRELADAPPAPGEWVFLDSIQPKRWWHGLRMPWRTA